MGQNILACGCVYNDDGSVSTLCQDHLAMQSASETSSIVVTPDDMTPNGVVNLKVYIHRLELALKQLRELQYADDITTGIAFNLIDSTLGV